MSDLNEALIASVLDAFYAKVRRDSVLGPVFDAIIGDDWTRHMQKINAFWCSALGVRRGYQGADFMPVHLRHGTIRCDQIAPWIVLFEQTVLEQVPEQHRERFLWVARAMAENLRISLAKRDAASTGS